MPSSYLKGISTITGKPESSFDEKVALVRSVYKYLRGNVMGRPPEGAWLKNRGYGIPGENPDRKGEEAIYAEPKYNYEIGELPDNGPFKIKLNTWRGSIVDVYKNPTKEEYQKILKRFHDEYPNAPKGEIKSRSTVDEEGNKYFWMSGDATHEMLESQLKEVYGIKSHQGNKSSFRF